MDKPAFYIKSLLLIGFLLATNISAFSQQTASPFDILPRLPQSDSPDSVIQISASSNPFDINRIDAQAQNRPSEFTPQFQVERKRKPLSAKEKTALYQRFLIVTVLTVIAIMTIVITIFRIFIAKIWKAFLNDNILSQLLREQGAGVTVGYLILYLIFFINAGLFTFLALKYFEVPLPVGNSNVLGLFMCIGGLALFYSAKHFLLSFIGYVFPIEKEVSRYSFTIMVFNIVAGIFLAPVILFAAYSSEGIGGGVIKLTILALMGVMLFRGLRGLFIANRFFAWHKFHFFLYLCTVELAPLLVTFKLLDVL